MKKNNCHIDQILPRGKWVFDEAVTNCFDNMIKRSIPDYQNMRNLVFDLGKEFVKKKYIYFRFRMFYRISFKTIC